MELRYLTPLSAAQQLAHGLDKAAPFAMADRVRHAELDTLNHVNNKAFVEWFETARAEHFVRLCAHHYGDLPQPRTVLRNAEIRYIREMLAGQSYIATMRVTGFRNTSYSIHEQIWSDGLCAEMSGVMVMLHPDQPGRYPLPAALKQYFSENENAR